jgi:membrane protein
MARQAVMRSTYRRCINLGRSFYEILARAVRSFNEVDAAEGAASMAFFAIFSLFPMLLLLVAVGSLVLQSHEAEQKVFELVSRAFPISRAPIERNLRRVLELRGAVGAVGLISLLWSASGFFSTLAYHLNRAWPLAIVRSFFKVRLVTIAIVTGLAGLLGLSLVGDIVLHLLLQYIPSWGKVPVIETLLRKHLSDLVPFLLRFLIFWGLYAWVPNTKVRWSEALGGALVAVVGVQATTAALTWYIGSGLARYELVYGSLGAIVALMLWIYFNSLITLFGAHLSAAIAQQTKPEQARSSEMEGQDAPLEGKSSDLA